MNVFGILKLLMNKKADIVLLYQVKLLKLSTMFKKNSVKTTIDYNHLNTP